MNCDLFINSYLKKVSKKLNINNDDAFEVFSISAALDRSFDDVYNNIIIKGCEDGGIDGIYFSEDYGNYTMHVFQCKNSKSIKQNQIEKFRNDFREIFIDGNRSGKLHASALEKNVEKFRSIVASGKLIDTVLYFIYNGKYDDKTAASNKTLTDHFNIKDEFEIWDSNYLYQRIRKLVKSLNKRKQVDFIFKPVNSNITSKKDNQGLISFSIYQVKAAIFRIPAIQLCELLDNEIKINETFEKIFAENIRGFLGKKNLTNEKIIETINSDKNVYFPFLNNGITIICEEFKLPFNPQLGEYHLPTKNPVIVNGLQTTYLLYEEYIKDRKILDDVFITIKLYETDDPELVELITDATNTQSAIGFVDKLSNKKFNIYAKELFENKGIGYITKRGEVFLNDKENLESTIHNTSLLPLWYSSFYESPHVALTTPKIMYKEIFQATSKHDHLLYPIFNGEIESPLYSQLYLVYTIIKIFESLSKLDTIDDDIIAKFETLENLGNEYVVFLIYKLIEDKLDEVSNELIVDAIYDLLSIIKITTINPAIYTTKGPIISSIIDINSTRYKNLSLRDSLKMYVGFYELLSSENTNASVSSRISTQYIPIESLIAN